MWIVTYAYLQQKFTDVEKACNFINSSGYNVIKTDGLAAGKGVIVADSNQQACDAVQQLFSVCSCFR